MTLSDDAAVAALIISLIALVVASAQLSQALFGTAEGYRRCADSVIGPWARLRRRKWIWSEFRFEVKFSTPHFIVSLADADRLESVARTEGNPYFLLATRPSHGNQTRHHRQILNTLHVSFVQQVRSSRDPELQDGDVELPERKATTEFVFDARVFGAWQPSTPRGEIMASWLFLLRALQLGCMPYYSEPHARGRTDIAVGVREWTWDFLPFDTQRPLATSTLNHIILLALRLNMQWPELNIRDKRYQGNGNGYSLSSYEVRGLPGVGFQFSSEPNVQLQGRKQNRICILSEAVDKLFFGIVPGCPSLVQEDFALITDNSTIDISSLETALGLETKAKLLTTHLEPMNETLALICPFLPIDGGTLSRQFSPLFVRVISVFHYWEGKAGLLKMLRERVKTFPETKSRNILERVLVELAHLEASYSRDFGGYWEQSIIETAPKEVKRAFLSDLCRLFTFTTRFFQGSDELADFDWTKTRPGTERTQYLSLVAAHVVMSHHSVMPAHEAARSLRRDVRDDATAMEKLEIKGCGLSPYMYYAAVDYADKVRTNAEHSVVRTLQGQGIGLSREEIEAAWWVLMLRGIVWDMSTMGDPPRAGNGPRYEGKPVPSSLYYNHTPVWIN